VDVPLRHWKPRKQPISSLTQILAIDFTFLSVRKPPKAPKRSFVPPPLDYENQGHSTRNISNDIRGVTLKLAIDSNGAVADLSATVSDRFTCEASLDMVHRLRRDCDAVLVGRATVEMDDCTLTVRRVPKTPKKQPIRVILDPKLRLDLNRFKVSTDGLTTIIVYALEDEKDEGSVKDGYFVTTHDEFPNVSLLGIVPDNAGAIFPISTKTMINVLRSQFQIHHILVEGGPRTARQFLQEQMVDRVIVVEAPITFAKGLPSNINSTTIQGAGLAQVNNYMLDVDRVTCYSRPNLSWPDLDNRHDEMSSQSVWP
jgi:riboflavin-specific deaminase-like protein